MPANVLGPLWTLTYLGAAPMIVLFSALAFVYVRLRGDDTFDAASAVSGWVAIATAIAAAVMAMGGAALLKALLGSQWERATYGDGSPAFRGFPGADPSAIDSALGLGLVVAGFLGVAVHLWVRRRVTQLGAWDEGVGHGVDILMALLAGLVALALTARAASMIGHRLLVEDSGVAALANLADAIAALAVAAIYGLRAIDHANSTLDAGDDDTLVGSFPVAPRP